LECGGRKKGDCKPRNDGCAGKSCSGGSEFPRGDCGIGHRC